MYCYSASLIICYLLLDIVTADPGEVTYSVEFTDSIISCEDFENTNIKADTMKLGLIPGKEGEPETFGMNGDIEVCMSLDSDYDVSLEVCKETEVSCEPMLTAQVNLCESMNDEDAPWFPVFLMMNVSSCPIVEGSYPIRDLILSMEPFKGCLSREFCGYYSVKLSIMNKLDVISCFMAYIEIVERQTE